MSSAAFFLRLLIRAYTFPYRRAHRSLSRSVKPHACRYSPPDGFRYEIVSFGGVRTEILLPPGAEGAILQFHGGGHTNGMNDMYRRAAGRLARLCSCAVYSIDYDAAPGLEFPAVHEQCYRAYAAIVDEVPAIAAIGDSFGAALMLSCCLKARDDGAGLPCALVCVSPFADMAASGDSYRYNAHRDPMYALPLWQSFERYESCIRRVSPYCGKTPLTDAYLSPAYADLSGFPDMLIIGGELETSASDGRMLLKNAQKSGVRCRLHEYAGMWHDFCYMFPKLKESRQAWAEVAEFFCGRINKS